ncbi:uncharacterized protein LOC111411209 [Olea europaea var. sylvestris]|uniref:uncharacterized protein LOC111411209 n=1 Tax=Olea europaea var. sylvestris TaxID=158386 RepID=UPI000C1D275F|nr:uncharacterized protein LOC111411209 [Olea europaea var. sylvestris]
MLTNKRKLPEFEIVVLTEESSVRVQSKLPPKLKDPGGFTLPISIGNSCSINAFCDTADRTIARSCGKVEDVLVKAGNFIFSVDFIVLDIPEDRDIQVIVGQSFLVTG